MVSQFNHADKFFKKIMKTVKKLYAGFSGEQRKTGTTEVVPVGFSR